MIDLFNSCGEWIMTNIQLITGVITSTNFVALCVTIITLIKQIKTNNKNTKSLNNVNESLTDTTSVKENVDIIKNVAEHIESDVQTVTEFDNYLGRDFKNFTETINSKIDAMLEVQTIVYSTIKDDTIRRTVNSILTDAKHCEANAKAKLQEEIEELKAKLSENTNKITEEITDAIDKVQDVINPHTDKTLARRY